MKKDRVVTFFVTLTVPAKATLTEARAYIYEAVCRYGSHRSVLDSMNAVKAGSVRITRPRRVTQEVIILPPKGR